MAMTRDAVKKRLEKLAQRMRRCAIHGTRLWCVQEVEWTGTPAEFGEGMDLYDRLHPYLPQWTPTNQRCPTCGESLVCEPCADAQRPQQPIWIPDEVISPEEYARWLALQGFFRRTPGTHHDLPITEIVPAWLAKARGATEPIVVPAPLTPPSPTPQVLPTPMPEPVVYEVDSDEVDESTVEALQSMIEQLTDQLKGRR